MRNLEKGQHIFIAFQNGKAVLDSQLRPRIYTSLENADKWTPTVNKGKIEYVEYAPTLTPPNEPLTQDSRLTPKMVTCQKGWQGVRNTRFYCPSCKKAVKKGEAYCHKCGQALIFPVQRYDKENNEIWLDFSDRRPPEGEEDA